MRSLRLGSQRRVNGGNPVRQHHSCAAAPAAAAAFLSVTSALASTKKGPAQKTCLTRPGVSALPPTRGSRRAIANAMEDWELEATLRAAATAVTPAPQRSSVKDNDAAQPFDYAAWMARLGETDGAAEMPAAPLSGEQQESASELFGRVGAPFLTDAALVDLAPFLQRHAEDASHHADRDEALPRPTEQLAEQPAVHEATSLPASRPQAVVVDRILAPVVTAAAVAAAAAAAVSARTGRPAEQEASCGAAGPAVTAHGVARLCTAAQDKSSTALHAEQAACASALQAEQERLAEAAEQGLLAERARGNAQAADASLHPLTMLHPLIVLPRLTMLPRLKPGGRGALAAPPA